MSSDVSRRASFAETRNCFEQPMSSTAWNRGTESHTLSKDERTTSIVSLSDRGERRKKSGAISSPMRRNHRTPSPATTRSSSLAGIEPAALTSNTSSPSRPSNPRQAWEQWLPERAGPRNLDIGIQPPSKSGDKLSDIASKVLDSPDFVLKAPRSGQTTPRKKPPPLRLEGTETIPLLPLSDKTSYLIDPDPEGLYKRIEQAQAQRRRPRILRAFSSDTGTQMLSQPVVSSRSSGSSPTPSQRRTHRNSYRPGQKHGRRCVSTPPVMYKRHGTLDSVNIDDSAKSYPTAADYPSYAVEYIRRESVATLDSGYSGSVKTNISAFRSRRRPKISDMMNDRPQIPHPAPLSPLSLDMGDAQTDYCPENRTAPSHVAQRAKERHGRNDDVLGVMKRLSEEATPQMDRRYGPEVRSPRHTRFPVTGRTSRQCSRINEHHLSTMAMDPEYERLRGVSRRASYSSFTGIRPVAEIAPHPHAQYMSSYPARHTLPRSARLPVLRVNTHASCLDRAMNGHSTGLTSPIGSLQIASGDAPNSPTPERKKVDDFDFVNTLNAASRPYTPDKFALDILNSQNGKTKTRSSSRLGVRSLVGFGATSRHSESEQLVNGSSPSIPKKVLRKTHSAKNMRVSLYEESTKDLRTSAKYRIKRNPFHGVQPDVYMTDIPVTNNQIWADVMGSEDNSGRQSSIDPGLRAGHDPASTRPSLFRLFDCTDISPTVSGLSVELARVSHQIHGDSGRAMEGENPWSHHPPITPSVQIRTEAPARKAPDVPLYVGSSAVSAAPLKGSQLEGPPRSRFLIVNMFREGRLFVHQSLSSGVTTAVGNFRERRDQDIIAAPQLESDTNVRASGEGHTKGRRRFMSFGKSKKSFPLDQRSSTGCIQPTTGDSVDGPQYSYLDTGNKRKGTHGLVSEAPLVGSEKRSVFQEDLIASGKHGETGSKQSRKLTASSGKTYRPSLRSLSWGPSSANMKGMGAAETPHN